MLSSYFATAIRNLLRNKLYSGVGILGLALGLSTALSAALVLRDQLSYDRFIAGYERTYLALAVLLPEGRAPGYSPATHNSVAALLKLRFGEIEAVTRIVAQKVTLRRGQIESKETLYWADPSLFATLPMPLFAGDLRTALSHPDSVVLTRSIARKYFGRDAPLGQTLELDHQHLLSVTAVIEDPPAHETQLQSGIFASGAAAYSELKRLDADPDNRLDSPIFSISVETFLRLAPGASPERIQKQMPNLMNEIWPRRPPGLGATMEFVRLDRVHVFPGLNPELGSRLAGTALVGVLILGLACINFVNLATARSARRATEVSIRKACGADRATLIVQFLAESFLHVGLAVGFALVITEWALPYINAFLDTNIVIDYWRSPVVIAWIVFGTLVLTVLAGLYPAFVVSAFRPATVLRGALTNSRSASLVWQSLVVLQFAALIGLMIATGVVYRQKIFATRNTLRVPTDQILLIDSPCNGAFRSELQRLPGVLGVGCSTESILTGASTRQHPPAQWRRAGNKRGRRRRRRVGLVRIAAIGGASLSNRGGSRGSGSVGSKHRSADHNQRDRREGVRVGLASHGDRSDPAALRRDWRDYRGRARLLPGLSTSKDQSNTLQGRSKIIRTHSPPPGRARYP